MSSRRIPLSSNQNAANSPLRNAALKQKRTLAQIQREEPYGQPPPAKKLVLDASTQRVVRSQPQQQPRASKSQIPIQARRPAASTCDTKLARERAAARHQQQEAAAAAAAAAVTEYTEKDIEEIQVWKNHHRARFPKSLFYFDQIPSEVAYRLKRQIAALGGRETAFFSVDVTHIITSRTIPTEDAATRDTGHGLATEKEAAQPEQEQAETINPSLLTRSSTTNIKRALFDTDLRARAHRVPPQSNDQALRPPKRAVDILIRAREMKKKIWTVDKLFRMTALLLETDPYRSADMAHGRLKYTFAAQAESRADEDRNLLRLLQKERVNGPSDRDPTVLARELIYFKGPYVYVYDIEEKQKPIMVKQYAKVPGQDEDKWPQFQTAALGRCPFIEDSEVREAREAREAKKAKEAQQKARVKADHQEAAAQTKAVAPVAKMAPPKPITGKRTLGEMELSHSRQSSMASAEFPSFSRNVGAESMDFSRKAFTSHAATGRLLGGEPVASGVQPSNVTSAIRSQMISSTATTPGIITGLSKEVHGLQRQVLKWNTPAVSQDRSSQQTTRTSFREENLVKRPATLSRTSSRKLEPVDEKTKEKEGTESSRPAKPAGLRKKPRDRDLKPGYCENCAEKYSDFDEHIESEKHRGFADDDDNWVELDDLLTQLERMRKPQTWKPTQSWTRSSQHDDVLEA
ncbi:putative g1 s regulator protein [Rosellinia necatrix]|uniref:Putative g1 s regulator protein n=1 Tax=Rosellinia necatrix TaxID=77044 RepID=A0A1W2TRW4_ROSNE|nr:putative g1 s regulator protein [Rosellinia necatrix]